MNKLVSYMKRNRSTLLLLLAVILGVGLIAYPTFSDWYNSLRQARAVSSYMEAVSRIDRDEYDRLFSEAQSYNEKLVRDGMCWIMDETQEEEYQKQLAVESGGIMCYIDIPKINVKLPVYHGTGETVLQTALGHIAGSSLPVGGESTHCVISGHRGLPSARLLTDLDKLEEGDTWTITVMDQILTYEADQIRVVEPADLSELQITAGKDYCTLVTCTPYGVNTHRLLVRGHRVANAQGDARVVSDALRISPVYIAPIIGGGIAVLLIVLMFVITGKQKRQRKETTELLENLESHIQGEKGQTDET